MIQLNKWHDWDELLRGRTGRPSSAFPGFHVRTPLYPDHVLPPPVWGARGARRASRVERGWCCWCPGRERGCAGRTAGSAAVVRGSRQGSRRRTVGRCWCSEVPGALRRGGEGHPRGESGHHRRESESLLQEGQCGRHDLDRRGSPPPADAVRESGSGGNLDLYHRLMQ